MKKIPRFKSKEEEAEFWMTHDTTAFWDSFETVKEPLDISPNLASHVRARHERTKLISIRLYPTQLRVARAIASKKRIPYQVLLRALIEQGLSRMIPRAA